MCVEVGLLFGFVLGSESLTVQDAHFSTVFVFVFCLNKVFFKAQQKNYNFDRMLEEKHFKNNFFIYKESIICFRRPEQQTSPWPRPL